MPEIACVCAQLLNGIQLFGTPYIEPTRLLYPQNFPIKNMEVGCHFILKGIFLTQESNSCLLLSSALASGFFITLPPGKPMSEIKVCQMTE